MDSYASFNINDGILICAVFFWIMQMVILSLIVNKSRVKALVKDKRVALEAFGNYVEVAEFNLQNYQHIVNLNCLFILSICSYILIIDYMMLVAKSIVGDTSDNRFLKKALRGVSTIICPNVCITCHASSLDMFELAYGLNKSFN